MISLSTPTLILESLGIFMTSYVLFELDLEEDFDTLAFHMCRDKKLAPVFPKSGCIQIKSGV